MLNKINLNTAKSMRNLLSAVPLITGVMVLAACDRDQNALPDPDTQDTRKLSTDTSESSPDPRMQALSNQAGELFGPLPAIDTASMDETKVSLGRMLYYDARLSLDRDISCNSCHQLNKFGVDNEPTSPGHMGQRGDRNSPTVYNAGMHIAQFWDGRAADLAEQAKGPVLNPVEMAMPSEAAVITTLASVPGYADLFEAAFPDDEPALTYDNVAKAIASFEEGLITPDRFDAFMQGNLSALSTPEINGLETFIQTGCASCHNGPALGGTMYQKMGLVKPYATGDVGRFAVTGNEADKYVFKVPGLRNIARTAPYLHDGSVTRLIDTIRLMAEHQLGKTLSDADAASIAIFLESLTGTPDADYIAKPELPADSDKAPQSDAS